MCEAGGGEGGICHLDPERHFTSERHSMETFHLNGLILYLRTFHTIFSFRIVMINKRHHLADLLIHISSDLVTSASRVPDALFSAQTHSFNQWVSFRRNEFSYLPDFGTQCI